MCFPYIYIYSGCYCYCCCRRNNPYVNLAGGPSISSLPDEDIKYQIHYLGAYIKIDLTTRVG